MSDAHFYNSDYRSRGHKSKKVSSNTSNKVANASYAVSGASAIGQIAHGAHTNTRISKHNSAVLNHNVKHGFKVVPKDQVAKHEAAASASSEKLGKEAKAIKHAKKVNRGIGAVGWGALGVGIAADVYTHEKRKKGQ